MAEEELHLQLLHGTQKYSLVLTLSLSVGLLYEEIARITQVPVHRQKVIWKGKALSDPGISLRELGICSKDKLMLLGKKSSPEEDKKVADVECVRKEVERLWTRCEGIAENIAMLDKGFLDKVKALELLERSKKQVRLTTEDLMKNVQLLDQMDLDTNFLDARKRRKALIESIHVFLKKADDLEAVIMKAIGDSLERIT